MRLPAFLYLSSTVFTLLALALSTSASPPTRHHHRRQASAAPSASASAVVGAPLRNLQVQQPPPLHLLAGGESKACVVLITINNFTTYDDPSIVQFTPPTKCGTPGSWSGVTMNFTGTSRGTQYDRLSTVFVGGVEVWRTSTAEPTRTNGIVWSVFKDVSKYIPLFAAPTEIVLNLGNVIDFNYGVDAGFEITLTATFYPSTLLAPKPKVADLILPLTDFISTGPKPLSPPPEKNVSVTLPRNAASAWVEITASGNSAEEFWYWNIADEYLDKVPAGSASGTGPFREVQLRIDGILAGVVWPYPVIFTGGINPLMWRPISAYGSFVQPTYTIDVSPFLGLLSDGLPHVFGLSVAGMGAGHSTFSNWFLGGNIQIVLSSSKLPTTGKLTSLPPTPFIDPAMSGTVSPDGTAVNVTVKATRELTTSGTVKTGDGKSTTVVWKQQLGYENTQTYFNNAAGQTVSQLTTGSQSSTHNLLPVLSDTYSFPLSLSYIGTENDAGDTIYATTVNHAYDRTEFGSGLAGIGSGSTIKSSQNAGASLQYLSTGLVTGFGASSVNKLGYVDTSLASYSRSISSSGVNITSDSQSGSLYWLGPLATDWWKTSLGGAATIARIQRGEFVGRVVGGSGESSEGSRRIRLVKGTP